MEELIQRIVSAVGIEPAVAEKAVGIILNMLQQNGPEDKVKQLIGALPGASDLVAKVAGDSSESASDGLGGMLGSVLGGGGGGIMEAVSQLSSAGVDTAQAKTIGSEVLNFAKEKAGDNIVDEITGSIPGLSALL